MISHPTAWQMLGHHRNGSEEGYSDKKTKTNATPPMLARAETRRVEAAPVCDGVEEDPERVPVVLPLAAVDLALELPVALTTELVAVTDAV